MTADLPIHPNEGDSFEVGAYYRSAFGDIYQVLSAPIPIGPTKYIVVAWVEYQEGYLARLSEGGGASVRPSTGIMTAVGTSFCGLKRRGRRNDRPKM